jgi:hypothetical protein
MKSSRPRLQAGWFRGRSLGSLVGGGHVCLSSDSGRIGFPLGTGVGKGGRRGLHLDLLAIWIADEKARDQADGQNEADQDEGGGPCLSVPVVVG